MFPNSRDQSIDRDSTEPINKKERYNKNTYIEAYCIWAMCQNPRDPNISVIPTLGPVVCK